MLTFRGQNSSYFCKVVYFFLYVMDLCLKYNTHSLKKYHSLHYQSDLSQMIKRQNGSTCFFDQGTWKLLFHPLKPKLYQLSAEKFMNPYLSASSLQFGLLSPAESCFTPESCRLLLLRPSSVRLEDWELRTEDRASQLLSERLQPLSLRRK